MRMCSICKVYPMCKPAHHSPIRNSYQFTVRIESMELSTLWVTDAPHTTLLLQNTRPYMTTSSNKTIQQTYTYCKHTIMQTQQKQPPSDKIHFLYSLPEASVEDLMTKPVRLNTTLSSHRNDRDKKTWSITNVLYDTTEEPSLGTCDNRSVGGISVFNTTLAVNTDFSNNYG